jgi:hypothetical protein
MNETTHLNDLVQDMPADIRLEVVLAELLGEMLSLDDIVVMSNSLFKRNYHRDIEKTGEIQWSNSKKKKQFFLVNRDGIYDRIPEDLFHQPPDINGGQQDNEAIIQAMKVQEEIEKSSRLFFLPIEQEFYRQRIKLEFEERSFLGGESDNLFDELWNLPECRQLYPLMPVLNKITGDRELTGFLMQHITGQRIEIIESGPCKYQIAEEPLLNQARLSIDTILGGELSSLQSSLTIKIYLSDMSQLTAYMPGGDKMKLMELLSSLFIPYEKDIIYELGFAEPVSFVTDQSRLNYTTTI